MTLSDCGAVHRRRRRRVYPRNFTVLMARVGAEDYAAALKRPGARPMDFTGKPLKSFVFVGAEGIESERALEQWVTAGVATARAEATKVAGRKPAARARRRKA